MSCSNSRRPCGGRSISRAASPAECSSRSCTVARSRSSPRHSEKNVATGSRMSRAPRPASCIDRARRGDRLGQRGEIEDRGSSAGSAPASKVSAPERRAPEDAAAVAGFGRRRRERSDPRCARSSRARAASTAPLLHAESRAADLREIFRPAGRAGEAVVGEQDHAAGAEPAGGLHVLDDLACDRRYAPMPAQTGWRPAIARAAAICARTRGVGGVGHRTDDVDQVRSSQLRQS